jgi:hypothetical protein
MTHPSTPWDHLAHQVAAQAAVTAALAYAHGQRCLTVVHGDPESPEDQAALHRLYESLSNAAVLAGGSCRQLVRTEGTNDTTTWWWASSEQISADEIVHQAIQLAHACARPWWRIRDNPA